jgi:glycosyltransferase involved in cell wall biosynthesis
MVSVIYITYDGLLDPLGASQIIPYLREISGSQGGVVVLSFEKTERRTRSGEAMAAFLNLHHIEWQPLQFTVGKGIVGKAWDLLKMYFWGLRLARRHCVRVVHARGHPAAQIGLFIKRLTGARLIFDFRGLWVDERVDKGGWNLKRASHRLLYSYFKGTERTLLANTDQLVVLTEAVVPEIRRIGVGRSTEITIIPCCADFEHFQLADSNRRAQAREGLGIPQEAFVFGYLGSVGRMYMLDRLFRLFELSAAVRHDIHLLVITQDVSLLRKLMAEFVPISLHGSVHVHAADRNQVPHIIAAMDVLVSFIQPSYARMAASPTKLAECFAAGIPVICNGGVGDVEKQVALLEAGCIVDPNSDQELLAAVAALDEIVAMGGARLRGSARKVLGLEVAAMRYGSVYKSLWNVRE